MTKAEYAEIARLLAESRGLSNQMRDALDSLDAILDEAECLGTDNIANLRGAHDAERPPAEQG